MRTLLDLSRMFNLIILLVLLCSNSVFAGGKPNKNEIAAYLNLISPKNFSVVSFEYKNFKGQVAGSGRTSVAGTMRLQFDLYQDSRFKWVGHELVNKGVPQNQIRSLIRTAHSTKEYDIVSRKGLQISFKAELRYTETVTGFNFKGRAKHPRITGRSKMEIPANEFVAGSPNGDNFLKTILVIYRKKVEREAELKRFVTQLSAFFSGSTLTVTRESKKGSPKTRGLAYLIECPSQNLLDTSDSNPSNPKVWIECTAVFTIDGRIGNSHFSSGEKTKLALEIYVKDKNNATMLQYVPDPNTGKFHTTGMISGLIWDGKKYYQRNGSLWIEGEILSSKPRAPEALIAHSGEKYTKEYDDGSIYIGQFLNGKQHGNGTYKLPNGYIYSGEWIGGVIEGMGRATYPNGSVYEGIFINGRPEGKGKMYYTNGTTFEGDWLYGRPANNGVVIYKNGSRYEGQFANQFRSGFGVMVFENGTRYEGNWDNDVGQGNAKITYSNNAVYEGSIRNGVPHGIGTMIYENGTRYEGDWNNNIGQGNAKITYSNNAVYEGSINNGVPHGIGIMIYGNGTRHEGGWNNGNPIINGASVGTAN